jgi:hypothetical protein
MACQPRPIEARQFPEIVDVVQRLTQPHGSPLRASIAKPAILRNNRIPSYLGDPVEKSPSVMGDVGSEVNFSLLNHTRPWVTKLSAGRIGIPPRTTKRRPSSENRRLFHPALPAYHFRARRPPPSEEAGIRCPSYQEPLGDASPQRNDDCNRGAGR